MKFLVIFFMLIGSVGVFAAEDTYLLSSQEFNSLTRDQQAEYLRSLQKIMAVMTKSTLYMASGAESSQSRMPASKIKPSSGSGINPAVDELMFEATLREVDKANPMPNGMASAKDEGYKIGSPKAAPAAATPTAAASAPAATPAKKEEAKPAAKKPEVIITETKEEQGVDVTDKLKNKKTEKSARSHYRCMYSGWVVATDPCKAQETFPDYYSIDGIDKSKMKCAKGQTMCNPTVFGLRVPKTCKKLSECTKDAEPICVAKGAWPTEDCYHKSTYRDALVAAEINSEINPSQYQHFIQNFADLCDADQIKNNPFAETQNGQKRKTSPEAIRHDIKITCGWAKKKMKTVYEAMKIKTDDGREKWLADKEKKSEKKSKTEGSQK